MGAEKGLIGPAGRDLV